MYTILSIVVIVVCVLLSLVVLMQDAKGGLNDSMGSVTQVAGVRATNEIEKLTWGLIIALVVLCIFSTISVSNSSDVELQTTESEVQQYLDENGELPTVNDVPSAPQQVPVSPAQ